MRQARLAALGLQRLGEPGVVLIGTARGDGTPRISPVASLGDEEPYSDLLF